LEALFSPLAEEKRVSTWLTNTATPAAAANQELWLRIFQPVMRKICWGREGGGGGINYHSKRPAAKLARGQTASEAQFEPIKQTVGCNNNERPRLNGQLCWKRARESTAAEHRESKAIFEIKRCKRCGVLLLMPAVHLHI
jgi:hypothetical protein